MDFRIGEELESGNWNVSQNRWNVSQNRHPRAHQGELRRDVLPQRDAAESEQSLVRSHPPTRAAGEHNALHHDPRSFTNTPWSKP